MFINTRTGERAASIPLWIYWLQLANRHADAAVLASEAAIPPLAMGRKVTAAGQPEMAPEGNEEMVDSMLAINCAASALDALFGSLQEVNAWKPVGGRKRRARRPREILEQLKHAFVVGKESQDWLVELDWLFDLRDSIVHHAERPRPLGIVAADSGHIVLSALEAYSLNGTSARRAADLADRILIACIENPRPATRDWATRAGELKASLRRIPGAAGGSPTIHTTQVGNELHLEAVSDDAPISAGTKEGTKPAG